MTADEPPVVPGPSSEALAGGVTLTLVAVAGAMFCAFSASWCGWSEHGASLSIGLRTVKMCVDGLGCDADSHAEYLGAAARWLGQAAFYATVLACVALAGQAVATLAGRARLVPMPVMLAPILVALALGTGFAIIAPGSATEPSRLHKVSTQWAGYVHAIALFVGTVAVYWLRRDDTPPGAELPRATIGRP